MKQEQRSDRGASETSTLIERIDHVVLRVRNIERALGFYRDIAGLEVLDSSQTTAELAPPGGTAILELVSEGVDSPADRRGPGLYHTAIRYKDRAALANALARLVPAGYRIGASDHGVSEALYIDDPDGNGVELYRDRPRDQWPEPAPGERVGMTLEPLDLQALLNEARDPEEHPTGTDIGHVHLEASDLAQTIDFYVNGLGLDLMAKYGDQAGFFSSRGYHHHLGANTWHSLGQRPAPKNHAGLERIVFGVETAAELGAAKESLEGYGHAVTLTGNELVVHDPDGIELHFVTG
jgi:catechol 2,3-dioxygenase